MDTSESMVQTKKRSRSDSMNSLGPERNEKAEKNSSSGAKGLRQFSHRVCQKVEAKGSTTYNEVADELVQELTSGNQVDGESLGKNEQKNIRRRVYDALNVLEAMNIIKKMRKEIIWVGLPSNSLEEINELKQEVEKRKARLVKKRNEVRDLIQQMVCIKNLDSKNSSDQDADAQTRLELPFILVNMKKTTKIDCKIKEDYSQYHFTFDTPFEINDDMEILKRLGLNSSSRDEIEEMLPANLRQFLPAELSVAAEADEEETEGQMFSDSSAQY